MKHLIALFTLSAVATAAVAQSKADIIVSYDAVSPTRYKEDDTKKMSLLASPTESKYFNEISLFNDSLSATPEGKARLQEIFMATCMTKNPDGSVSIDMRKGPTKKVHTYIYNKPSDNLMTVYDKFGEDHGYYTEANDEQLWDIISDSTATILGYECIMAQTDYHGRRWTAWFTPEIAVPFGPWKLRGLPGLILRAEAVGNFSFEATGIEKTDRSITPIYSPDDYTKTERKKALADNEYAINNAEALMKAKYGDNIKFSNRGAGMPKFEAEKHSLEPDYK